MASHTSYEEYRAALEKEIACSREHAHTMQQSKLDATAVDVPWKAAVDGSLKKSFNLPAVSEDVVHPPRNVSIEWGPDYALPMFVSAKVLQANPVSLAAEVARVLGSYSGFSRVEATGPYVNMRLADGLLMANLKDILSGGGSYGHLTDNVKKVVIVEYSSPNIAKPFGINHLRSTVIGESLARVLDASGYTVIRDNHLGDWGTQFGNLLAACQEYAADRDFATFTMDELTELHLRFNQEKRNSPRLVRLGQTCFARLESGDPGLREKWAIAVSLSLQEFCAVYERLDVHFDTMIGEGYYVPASNALIEELPGLAPSDLVVFDTDTKAVYIDAEHPVVIRTQDGYGVYAARDLATVRFRQQTYNPDIALYVVGEEQSSYFRSVFEVADKAGLSNRPDGLKLELEHVSFGLLLDKDGKKLSTRKGTSGKLEDVIAALDAHAVEETRKRNPTMDPVEIREIARKIAIGALIWNDLRADRTSSVRFDIEKMLELGGGSVIDALYTYSRTCSILDKLAIDDDAPMVGDFPESFSTEVEHQLSLYLSEFGSIIRKTAAAREPHVLILYLQELSQLHGRFYEESRVVDLDDVQLANLRIVLHRAYKVVIENGLGLLNIPVSKRL